MLKCLAKLLPHVEEIILDGRDVLYLDKGKPIPSSRLSAGHKCMVAMVGDLIIRLTRDQAQVDRLVDLEGLVLIDELETTYTPVGRWPYPSFFQVCFPWFSLLPAPIHPFRYWGRLRGPAF